jgi:D-alanyl-D-alanine carboxypeptidase/D-alanyl-D-alanine-endopeptidase (penicillin-binding protein 4)
MPGLTPPVSRRWLLAALISGAATGVLAEAPPRSPRSVPRPGRRAAGAAPALGGPTGDDLVAAARLGGSVGFLAVDSATGAVVEARDAGTPLPPASTAKVITALYALDRLGPGFRFGTRLVATGPVAGGMLQGDLVLSGSGDPTLSTDSLAAMAAALRAGGVTAVAGRFLFDEGALPYLAEIDPDQPVQAGYNPAISGLNLNFNRVHFEWRRGAKGWNLALDARSERYVPKVGTVGMSVVERELPVFTFAEAGGQDTWTVASAALGDGGSRWLPVRRPGAYAADVFRTLLRAEGIDLPAAAPLRGRLAGSALVDLPSAPLPEILSDMLRFSTNLTAEVVGLTASGGAARSLAASGREMSGWARARFGRAGRHVDHSGLEADSRAAPADLVAALVAARAGPLRAWMKDFPLKDAAGREIGDSGARVAAKTGTLNFVSGLAGYVTAPGGRDVAFAIFAADPARRDAVPLAEREDPPGLRDWMRRARLMQSQLLFRWAGLTA